MAQVENPVVVRFVNAGLRPLLTQLVEVYHAADALNDEYVAGSIADLIPNTTDLIADNEAATGRPAVSAAGVKLIMSNLAGLLTQLKTADQNGISMIAGAMSVSPRFARQ